MGPVISPVGCRWCCFFVDPTVARASVPVMVHSTDVVRSRVSINAGTATRLLATHINAEVADVAMLEIPDGVILSPKVKRVKSPGAEPTVRQLG